jgi:undecaprenyl-diphosphatase
VLAYVLAQVLVSLLLVHVLKIVVGRPRPANGGPFTPLTLDSGHKSFPSGHVTEVIGAALPFAQRCRKISLALFLGLYAALMGFSRIYLEAHYPSDVAASLVFGSFSGWLAWRFSRLPLPGRSRWTGRLIKYE